MKFDYKILSFHFNIELCIPKFKHLGLIACSKAIRKCNKGILGQNIEIPRTAMLGINKNEIFRARKTQLQFQTAVSFCKVPNDHCRNSYIAIFSGPHRHPTSNCNFKLTQRKNNYECFCTFSGNLCGMAEKTAYLAWWTVSNCTK